MQVGAGIYLHAAAHLKLNERGKVLSKVLSGGGNICEAIFLHLVALCVYVCVIPALFHKTFISV